MSLSLPPASRALVVVAVLAAGLSACGRRGALEPPPVAAVPAAPGVAAAASTGADDEVPDTILPSASPAPATTSRDRRRGYTIPKEPFILDPLL